MVTIVSNFIVTILLLFVNSEMQNEELFIMSTIATRMNRVLSAYSISVNAAASICKDISPSALKSWVSGNRVPSIDGVLAFATAFGLSIDWLVGISKCPYTPDSVKACEEDYGLMTPDTGGHNVFYELFVLPSQYNGDFVGDERIERNASAYEDDKLRAEKFSLEARANAIVCQLFLYKKEAVKDSGIGSRRLGMSESNIFNALKIIALTGTAAFHINTDQ